jgi:oligopeptide transport system ATP-binding protein
MNQERTSILSAKDVVVKFRVRNRELTAIRSVSLDLYDGETLAIVGESGSGKTVLTKTFTGMLESNGRIHSGSIFFEGQDLTQIKTDKDWEKIRGAKISTVFQDPMTSLNPLKKIGVQITEVIEKHQKLSPDEAKRIALELMAKVGIKEPEKRFSDYPFQYSGGMRQRIVIAIALACKPKILICDEPTTALDVTIQAQILELIKALQKEYKFTTIYITHDLGVVANVADRVAVMYAGQIVEYGTVREIFYDPRHPYTWALLSSLPTLARKGKPLFAIPGTPPTLFNQIRGDAFAPRNRFALNIDFEEEPPFFKVSDTHFAKTWLLDPRSPAAEPPEAVLFMRKKASLHSEKSAEAAQ